MLSIHTDRRDLISLACFQVYLIVPSLLPAGKREDLGKKESGKPKVKSPVQKPSPGGLFDNDQEDDDLFAALAPKKPPLKPCKSSLLSSANINGHDLQLLSSFFSSQSQWSIPSFCLICLNKMLKLYSASWHFKIHQHFAVFLTA